MLHCVLMASKSCNHNFFSKLEHYGAREVLFDCFTILNLTKVIWGFMVLNLRRALLWLQHPWA